MGGLDVANERLVMRNPTMVIGSDRMELYEFFSRRKESWSTNNRSFMKLAFGLTVAHFALVQIP